MSLQISRGEGCFHTVPEVDIGCPFDDALFLTFVWGFRPTKDSSMLCSRFLNLRNMSYAESFWEKLASRQPGWPFVWLPPPKKPGRSWTNMSAISASLSVMPTRSAISLAVTPFIVGFFTINSLVILIVLETWVKMGLSGLTCHNTSNVSRLSRTRLQS